MPATRKTPRSRGLIAKSTEAVHAEVPSKQPALEENWFRLGYLIHDVSRMRRTVFDERFKPEGITRSQWWALSNIFRNGGDGILCSELARLMDVGKVTIGGLVDRLEEAGYVYRRMDKSDLRAKKVFVTEAGKRLMVRMRVITEELNRVICEEVTPEQIATTEQTLLRMKNKLRELLRDKPAEGISSEMLTKHK